MFFESRSDDWYGGIGALFNVGSRLEVSTGGLGGSGSCSGGGLLRLSCGSRRGNSGSRSGGRMFRLSCGSRRGWGLFRVRGGSCRRLGGTGSC